MREDEELTLKKYSRRSDLFPISLNLSDVTTVEVDGANKFQVGVYSPDAVHVTAVLESGANRCFIQVPGLALHPNVKKESANH